jgi:hypothetical protein
MNGQWLGRYNGTNSGTIMVNIDDLGSFFRGVAYLRDSNQKFPAIGAGFSTKNKDAHFEFSTQNLWPLHPKNGDAATDYSSLGDLIRSYRRPRSLAQLRHDEPLYRGCGLHMDGSAERSTLGTLAGKRIGVAPCTLMPEKASILQASMNSLEGGLCA